MSLHVYRPLCRISPQRGGDTRSIYVYGLIGMLHNCHPAQKVSLPLAFILGPQKAPLDVGWFHNGRLVGRSFIQYAE